MNNFPKKIYLTDGLGERTFCENRITDNDEMYVSAADLHDILECNHQLSEGNCVWCNAEDFPVDEKGNRIKTANVENAIGWHIDHFENCPVVLIEKLFIGAIK